MTEIRADSKMTGRYFRITSRFRMTRSPFRGFHRSG